MSHTYIWHTQLEGYRSRIVGIAKQNNWYEKVRPGTKDAIEWDLGWVKADKDSFRGSYESK